MRYFVLVYYVTQSYLEKRAAFREAHLTLARESNARGELLLAGALGDPIDRALLLFRAADRGVAEQFASKDPYVLNGLVERWEVQPWAVVVGLRPGDFNPLAAASATP
jgi:uncharacterized protein